MLRSLALLGVIVVVVSCNRNAVKNEIYWNSLSYFEQETARLTEAHIGLDKKLLFENREQTSTLLSPDWKKELEPFLSIDLQKVSYQGRFDIDTLVIGDSVYQIEYKTNASQTDLQSCSIVCSQSEGTIISFSATFKHLNNLYQSTKTYTYTPQQGYAIRGDQQVKLVTPVDYEIEGNFMYP